MNLSHLLEPARYALLALSQLERAKQAARDLPWRSVSYAQHNEDFVVAKLCADKSTGFYVDIGAHDPTRLSNTKYFYRRGWTGINIEPIASRYRRFVRERPRDINLNIGISRAPGQATLYVMEPDTLTTFLKTSADYYASFPHHRIADIVEVEVFPLSDVLDLHASNRSIDFMSIDVEGLERTVLFSNNWHKHRPRAVIVESVTYVPQGSSTRLSTNADWEEILLDNDYVRAIDTAVNSIYVDRRDATVLAAVADISRP